MHIKKILVWIIVIYLLIAAAQYFFFSKSVSESLMWINSMIRLFK